MKQNTHLKLVDSAQSEAGAIGVSEGFDFVALDELSPSERARVESLVEVAAPSAACISVARTSRAWDLRPVVMCAGEDGPSLIRLLGPDVALSSEISTRITNTFERLHRFDDVSAEVVDWGMFEDQLWYRRPLVSSTLAHIISSQNELTVDLVIDIVTSLVDQINAWHAHGIIHGHITTSNIVYRKESGISLLDASAGVALAQAAKDRAKQTVSSLAPEVLDETSLRYSVDIYGIGQVIRRLVVAIKKKSQFEDNREQLLAKLEPLQALSAEMVHEDVEKRISLSEVLAGVRELGLPNPSPKKKRKRRRNKKKKTQQVAPPVPEEEPEIEDLDLDLEGFEQASEEDVLLDEDIIEDVQKSGKKSKFAGITEKFESIRESDPNAPSSGMIGNMLMALGAGLLLFLVYTRIISPGGETVSYSIGELQQAWASNIPSRMVSVAELAVSADFDAKDVQDIIVASAKQGAELPAAVNLELLRIAFDNRWEQSLTAEDRRLAIALGLVRLLGDRMPRDLASLDQTHPGVLLAIAANAGENTRKVLDRVPAVLLAKLPQPIGKSFLRLIDGKNDLPSSDIGVHLLSRFVVHPRSLNTQEIPLYLQENPVARLQALAILFSQRNADAQFVLDLLLNHPNMVLENPELVWARNVGALMSWDELEPADKLFVLSGIQPFKPVRAEHVGRLFMHPYPPLRSYAVKEAIDRIQFKHPGAFAVLSYVRANPNSVTPEQLFGLAEFLENPEKLTKARVRRWLDTSPADDVLLTLLIASRKDGASLPLDAWLSAYLRAKGWQGEPKTLGLLAQHPDEYTRFFAYTQIYTLKDSKQALSLLQAALQKERNPKFQKQLDLMVRQLQNTK